MAVSFTTVALVATLAALPSLGASLRPCVCCTWVLVNSSFQCAVALDRSVYARMRAHRRWTIAEFYAGHAALHLVPLCAALAWWAPLVTVWHLAASSALHIAWVGCVSPRGRFADLSRVYVPMERAQWTICIAVGVLSQLSLLC